MLFTHVLPPTHTGCGHTDTHTHTHTLLDFLRLD